MSGKTRAMVPHELPRAIPMRSEMPKLKVGRVEGSMPLRIQLEKRRSAPTSCIMLPEAQAKVRTMRDGKILVIPPINDSTNSLTFIRALGYSVEWSRRM